MLLYKSGEYYLPTRISKKISTHSELSVSTSEADYFLIW